LFASDLVKKNAKKKVKKVSKTAIVKGAGNKLLKIFSNFFVSDIFKMANRLLQLRGY
jgi:hypothetical protein